LVRSLPPAAITNHTGCDEEFHKANTHAFWVHLKSTGSTNSLLQVTKLASLIVTIPATNAGSECPYSCLKRIKTHSRNFQSQNRLSDLSLLSVEKLLSTKIQNQNLFYSDVLFINIYYNLLRFYLKKHEKSLFI